MAAMTPDDKMDTFRQDPSYQNSVGGFQLDSGHASCPEEQLTCIITDGRTEIAELSIEDAKHETRVQEFFLAHGITNAA